MFQNINEPKRVYKWAFHLNKGNVERLFESIVLT